MSLEIYSYFFSAALGISGLSSYVDDLLKAKVKENQEGKMAYHSLLCVPAVEI